MMGINKLEAVVFSEGGEILIGKILDVLEISTEQLIKLIQEYNNTARGLVLVQDNKKVLMRVASEYADLVEELRKATLKEDISKAGLEVLAIVLYRGVDGTSASEVEQVRGVNSGYTLRQLTMRGFLSKSRHGMSYRYQLTAELLSHLGVVSSADLPSLSEVRGKLREFEESQKELV